MISMFDGMRDKNAKFGGIPKGVIGYQGFGSHLERMPRMSTSLSWLLSPQPYPPWFLWFKGLILLIGIGSISKVLESDSLFTVRNGLMENK